MFQNAFSVLWDVTSPNRNGSIATCNGLLTERKIGTDSQLGKCGLFQSYMRRVSQTMLVTGLQELVSMAYPAPITKWLCINPSL